MAGMLNVDKSAKCVCEKMDHCPSHLKPPFRRLCESRFFHQVWQVLASVLHISNIQFDKVDHAQGEVAAIADREVRFVISQT